MALNSKLTLYWLLRSLSASTATSTGGRRRRLATRLSSVRSRTRIAPVRSTSRPIPTNRSPAVPEPSGPCTVDGPTLQIRCLGRFEVRRDGVLISEWRRDKARTLFKHLVDRRHPVHRDILVELLWPESDSRAASNCLRVTLHALRQALGRASGTADALVDYVKLDGTNVSLNHHAGLWIDVEAFSENIEAGFRFERDHRMSEALRCYEAAEALYRDDYLVEDLYEDWTLVRREELKDQYLMIVTHLADACLTRRDQMGCIIRCHRILEKDPCREDAYCRLMRCYAELGQVSQALHWYDLCVLTLRKELDIAPSEQTTHMRELIIDGRH